MRKERLQVRVLGIVQGVGFRPFVYRIANEMRLCGWIRNDGDGVTIEVEGTTAVLLQFLERLQKEKPPPAFLYAVDHRFLTPAGYEDFAIVSSEPGSAPQAWILPDLATCEACRRELLDPANRRYRYPFINCTHCGPRYTIIQGLPYDRPLTVMSKFQQCEECNREYNDPSDRRFHAQPNACAQCGPELEFTTFSGDTLSGEQALRTAEQFIREGKIIAVKGIGGFHLMFDATNESAAGELRKRKRRQKKPFAVMYPDLTLLKNHVTVPLIAETFLGSTQSPILLLQRTSRSYQHIASSVAPDSPYLGVYLPYTPLHILLLHDLAFPVVATSGNLTDEPIAFQDQEAQEKLRTLCDGVLTHNRPIAHHADDSVLQIIEKPVAKPQMLRRARGYTPLPLLSNEEMPPMLALGGHLNCTFAISRRKEIILSPHLGDMETYESQLVYRKTLDDFLTLYQTNPSVIVHDLHPDYFTTHLAEEFEATKIAVQHHHAHLAACMLENNIAAPALGLTWDGTGYGPDQTVWGGEFLLGGPKAYDRVASLYPFRLPGGEKAIHETWRTALSLLWEAYGTEIPTDLPLFKIVPNKSIELTLQMLEKGLLSPVTTSMGRLFDGVSAILGLSYYNTHQAESAQLLEYAAWRGGENAEALFLPFIGAMKPPRLDWRPLIRQLVEALRGGESIETLASVFHRSVASSSMQVIASMEVSAVALTGGVFCNRYLTEQFIPMIQSSGKEAYVHSQLPPTDGNLSVGQLWVAAQKAEPVL